MHLELSVLSICLIVVLAQNRYRPANAGPEQNARILHQTQEVNFDGNYEWSFETENGIAAQERGAPKVAGAGPNSEAIEEVQGQFQYTAPDGTPILVQYLANENGFQPQGAHLPVPPPIPAAIQKALDWIAAHPSSEDGPTSGRPPIGRRRP